MKHAALSLVAVLIVIAAMVVPPARANGTVRGEVMQISVAEFPDVCPPGVDMHGTIAIELFKSPDMTPRIVTYDVFFETPLGPAVLNDGRFRMRPGHTKVAQISFPVAADAEAGWYRMMIVANCGVDRLVVGHEFFVPGK